jgi:hypothetical protein
MKNTLSVTFALVVLTAVGLGCGAIDPFSGSKESNKAESSSNAAAKSNTNTTEKTTEEKVEDKVIENTAGRSTIGVPECDEVMDLIEAEANNPEDNILVRAGKATVLNRIKDGIRESIERNKQDTTELAKTCKEFKTQFDKFKAETGNKGGQ